MNKYYYAMRMTARDAYKTWTLHHLYPQRYRKLIAEKPVNDHKIVFLEVRMNTLTDSFLPVYRALEKEQKWELKTCFIQEGMTGREKVRRNCLAALEDLADAKFIFVNDSCYLLGCLPLRPETKVIQLWHACGAFKKFGYSIADKKFGADRADLERFPVHRNFSRVTVSSQEVVWAYAEAFHMEDRIQDVLPTGIARTDCFYDEERRQLAFKRLREALPGIEPEGKTIVLYAPTFRGRVADASSPDVLDYEELHSRLGDSFLFLIKHHPFVKKPPVLPEAVRDYARDVSRLMEIEDLLMVSDVCISDYSSLIFEYSLMEKPMLFLAHDLEDYGDWRGFYYPFEEMTPGPVVRTTGETADFLEHLDQRFDRERVHAFREKFMGACDGHATERILALLDETNGG